MTAHTEDTSTDAERQRPAWLVGWAGLDADATAKLTAPLQAYPRLMMTAYRAWLEMGTES